MFQTLNVPLSGAGNGVAGTHNAAFAPCASGGHGGRTITRGNPSLLIPIEITHSLRKNSSCNYFELVFSTT